MSETVIPTVQDIVGDIEIIPHTDLRSLNKVLTTIQPNQTVEAVERGNERLDAMIDKQKEQIYNQREQLAKQDEQLQHQREQLARLDEQLSRADKTIAEIKKSSFQANVIGIIAIFLALLSLILQFFK